MTAARFRWAGLGTLDPFSTEWCLAVAVVVLGVSAIGWVLVRQFPTIADLWAALRAVFVPLVGIALMASFSGSRYVTCVVIAAMGLVLYIVFKLDHGAMRAVRESLRPWVVRLVAIALALNTMFLFFLAPQNELVDEAELATEVYVWTGFLLWGLVLLLRVGAFARPRLRLVLVFVLLAAYVRYFGWLFVGGSAGRPTRPGSAETPGYARNRDGLALA